MRNLSDAPNAAFDSYRTWKSWEAESFGVCSSEAKCYFEAEFRKCGLTLQTGAVVLEVGFGNGEFAAWAVSHGAQYVGTERDEELVRIGRERGFSTHRATLELKSLLPSEAQGADIVVLFDVLEHLDLEEILGLLCAARDCLVDGGMVLARFPSGDSPFSRSIQYGDLTHRTAIGGGMIRQCAGIAGLQVVQVRPPAFPLRGLGLRRFIRRATVAMLEMVLSALINLAFHNNMPRVMNANMVVLLRKAGSVARR